MSFSSVLPRMIGLTAVLVAVFASVLACGSTIERLDPTKLPEDLRDDYALFARRCSKCHSLARPLNAGITDDSQWVMYVNRMRRQPGSGISLADQERILRFLRYYAAELRQREAEKKVVPSSSVPAPVPVPVPVPDSPVPPAPSGSP
jgi:hypothetical protein